MTSITVTIRAAALPAWHALQAGLRDHTPPCTSDPDAWTSDDPEERAYAARACRGCPVLAECGRFAEANHETFGVWGAVDRGDRAAVRSINNRKESA